MGVLVKMTSFLLLSLLCTLASCSPVVEVEVEDRGLLSDIALGMLVGKIQEMLGITTTPAPRPIIDGIFGILGGDTATTTAAPPTDEEKMVFCNPSLAFSSPLMPPPRPRPLQLPPPPSVGDFLVEDSCARLGLFGSN